MVVAEMYCREQIVIPEQLPIILKKYAKAVIRTQPYDLLRWSAAYFRCLAMEATPPAKLRYEPEQKFGSLTRGYIRVLAEQLGKGYFVKRRVLLEKWQAVCLPEEQIFDFLSLCRMLNWENVHWLKLLAVMVGALNKALPNTLKMICELLTDEPEGSPAPIPMWMFHVCYKFLAELDCTEPQMFIDGRKVLPGDVLEDEEDTPPTPQIFMASCFEDLLINEWKSRMKYDQVSISSLPEKADAPEDDPAVTEISSGLTAISSNFKFVGNFDDPAEVIRRAPDFDSVVLLLQDEFNHVCAGTPPYSVSEIMRMHQAKHDRMRDKICETNAEIARDIEEKQRIEMLKKIGPPWSWLAKFTDHSCPARSYNFVDVPASSTPGSENGDVCDYEFAMNKARGVSAESSRTVLECKGTSSAGSRTNESESAQSHIRGTSSSAISRILTDVICSLEEKQSQGKVSIDDIQSMSDAIQEDFAEVPEAVQLQKFLEKAQDNDMEFKDLNELNNFFISETVKLRNFIDQGCLDDDEPEEIDPAQTLKECAEPDKVVEIFDESGIEVDNRLLQKKVSDRMILGLVDKGQEEDPVTPESIKSIQSDSTTTASELSNAKRTQTSQHLQTHEQVTQTTPFLQQQKEKFRQQMEQAAVTHGCKSKDTTVKSLLPSLPGIGPRISDETVEKFLLYMMRRAREQKGYVFPRNWQEVECPPMMDEVSGEEQVEE